MAKGAVTVARHGERIDYYLRNKGGNWLTTAPRPWDPPLTFRGQLQGRELGKYLEEMITKHNLPPIEAVYSSPLVRCCMTAAEVINGYEDAVEVSRKKNKKDLNHPENDIDIDNGFGEKVDVDVNVDVDVHHYHQPRRSPLKVTVENGLVESLNKNWYSSWCLKDSDGTWGGPPMSTCHSSSSSTANVNVNVNLDISNSIDARAKNKASTLLPNANDIVTYLSNYEGCMEDDSLSSLPSLTSSNSSLTNHSNDVCPKRLSSRMNINEYNHHHGREGGRIGIGSGMGMEMMVDSMVDSMESSQYTWGTFETKREQQDRMENVVSELSNRHSNGTILLLSHGGPVTHLYERLMTKSWKSHGISSYTCFSIYQKKDVQTMSMEGHDHVIGVGGDHNVTSACSENADSEQTVWNALAINDSSHLEGTNLK